MSLSDIWAACRDGLKIGGLGVILGMTVIQISPIKLNPWKAVGRLVHKGFSALARLMNKEVIDQIQVLQTDVTDLKTDMDSVKSKQEALQLSINRNAAVNARARILRFGDELLYNTKHSKDHYNSILRDAHNYEEYCKIDKDFENGVTEPTIEYIRSVYKDRLNKNDFL